MEGLPAVAPMGGRKGCLDGGLVWHCWEVPGLDTCPSHLPRTVRGTQGPDFATKEAKKEAGKPLTKDEPQRAPTSGEGEERIRGSQTGRVRGAEETPE